MKKCVSICVLFANSYVMIATAALGSWPAFTGTDESGQPDPSVTNTVLCATDISGLEIISLAPAGWMYADAEPPAWPHSNPGVQQNVALNGIKSHIVYSEFITTNLSHQGFNYRMDGIINNFTLGVWPEAEQQSMGDVSWYCGPVTYTEQQRVYFCLFVLYKTFCFKITCFDHDDTDPTLHRGEAVMKNVCEQLAVKILKKIDQGGKVFKPIEPPPTP